MRLRATALGRRTHPRVEKQLARAHARMKVLARQTPTHPHARSTLRNGNRALAVGVVGGMSVGTIALLFVVPAFFIIFQTLHEKFAGKKNTEE